MHKRYLIFAAVSALLFFGAIAEPALAQGMRSVASTGSPAEFDLQKLQGINELQTATLQRLLRRLNYLKEEDVSRQLDVATGAAISRFLASVKSDAKLSDYDGLLRLLFTTVWNSEGWGKGEAPGQDTIVDADKVKASQEVLKKLGYEPGPADGKFGPATVASIEVYQQDIGMKIDGLLTRNTYESIQRSLVFQGKNPIGKVRVLNWPDYIDPAMLERFSKETKIEVVYDVLVNSDETQELLLAKSPKYDVMVQNSSRLRSILEENAIQELDLDKLPNFANLDPEALRYTGRLDPGNKHSLPYMWGTVGIGVNETAVKRILPDVKVNSLALLLDPKVAQQLSACGLGIVDEATDIVPALIAYVGGDISNIGIADLESLEQVLSQVAPYISAVSVDRYIDDFAEGKYCVMMGYSGDMFMARDAAKTAGKGTLSYYVPIEGSQLWFDHMVIPQNAPNPDAAYRFMNFLLDPEVAAANTNYVQYANPNKASAPYIDEALLNDPGLYPPSEVLARLEVLQPLTPNVEQELERIWKKLKR